MLMKGNDPSAAFNLENMLRSCGRNVVAETALHAALQIDPAFAEARYNFGDLLDDQGRTEAAIESLRKAVQVAPDYSDAMFNLALMRQRKINVRRRQITGGAISPVRTRRSNPSLNGSLLPAPNISDP